MSSVKKALKKVFSGNIFTWGLLVSVFINVSFLYYFLLLQTTTWEIFWRSNISFYNWSQVVLSLLNALGIALAVVFFFYIWEKRESTKTSILGTLGSLVFSSAATGCTVCGAFLLPTLGIAASLTALPLGGLEIKLLSLLLLGYVIFEYSRLIAGACKTNKHRVVYLSRRGLEFEFSREALSGSKTLFIFVIFALIIYSLPKLPSSWRFDFRRNQATVALPSKPALSGAQNDSSQILAQINPVDGYNIEIQYGDLGPKMISGGVIDLAKFKGTYDQSGQPLTKEQLKILTKGSNQNIKISSKNSYFLLNFFWAVGLANKNKILTEGKIAQYGPSKVGSFASTGGWTLGKGKATSFLSNLNLISLSSKQQKLVEQVSSNIYRPCCNNSTAFPDCNHGMALLGVLELMAANGASQQEMYQAAKYFNAYWFPQSYYDLALYFQAKEGKDFASIDPKVILSKEYSSASGYRLAKRWLSQNGLAKQPVGGGSGCGV